MTDREVVESIQNAWLALGEQYRKHPDEAMRCAMNLLANIINKVEAEVKKAHKEGQITIEEWIATLQESR